jgi:glycosyltransferase Alg8
VVYSRLHYPRLRRQADAAIAADVFPKRLFVIVASYLEEPWVSVETFQALMSNLMEVPCQSTIVVAAGSDKDEALIASVFNAHPGRRQVELVFQRQSKGKRIAMGHALRAVARCHADEPDSVTVLRDSDSWLEPGAVRRTLGFFMAFRDLGAVTTNEVAWTPGGSPLYRDWFELKFGQRHVLFQSHSLSHRVLTLTGRFSVFRTSVVVAEDFIRAIENDTVTHWMHGSFRFLMGDDKSTWFQVLKGGWKMLYLPDVTCCSLESRDIGFFKASLSLPYRWFGNTLSNNPRALALGPRRTGLFIWFALLDQRLSMWTSLVGVAGALALAATKSFLFLPLYLAWAMHVRVFQLTVIVLHGREVSLRSLPIMLYTQWVGSVIKIHSWFHLADQSWGKGSSRQTAGSRLAAGNRLARVMPSAMMALCCVAFGFTVMVAHGALRVPELSFMSAGQGVHVIDARSYGVTPGDGQDDAAALQTIIDRVAAQQGPVKIELPAGQLDFFSPVTIRRGDLHLVGASQQQTRIVSHLRAPQEAVISVQGSLGAGIGALGRDLESQDVALQLEPSARTAGLKPGDLLLLKQPNDEAFFDAPGSSKWRRTYPVPRQALVKVKSVEGPLVQLELPSGVNFQAPGTRAWRVNALQGVTLSDFTIEQKAGERRIADVAHRYDNLLPEFAVDGIALDWTSGAVVERVGVLSAGRNPVSFENSYGFALRQCALDGAWNKGDGGSGYRGVVDGCDVRNIRHIALQWSSAFNQLRNIRTTVDINYHGGYSHNNTAQAITSAVPAAHPWPAVFRTPRDAGWTPPDGPENLFRAGASEYNSAGCCGFTSALGSVNT